MDQNKESDCRGCTAYDINCMLSITKINKCPCIECLVKVICLEVCYVLNEYLQLEY